jgi:hypothetical protein
MTSQTNNDGLFHGWLGRSWRGPPRATAIDLEKTPRRLMASIAVGQSRFPVGVDSARKLGLADLGKVGVSGYADGGFV